MKSLIKLMTRFKVFLNFSFFNYSFTRYQDLNDKTRVNHHQPLICSLLWSSCVVDSTFSSKSGSSRKQQQQMVLATSQVWLLVKATSDFMQHSPAQDSCEAGTHLPKTAGRRPEALLGRSAKASFSPHKRSAGSWGKCGLTGGVEDSGQPAAPGCFPTMPWVRLFFRRSKAAGNPRNVSLRFRSRALTHLLGASCPRHRPGQAGLSLEVSRRGFGGCSCVRSLAPGRSAGGITARGCWPPSRSSYPAWLVLPGVCYVLSRISCAICMVAGG